MLSDIKERYSSKSHISVLFLALATVVIVLSYVFYRLGLGIRDIVGFNALIIAFSAVIFHGVQINNDVKIEIERYNRSKRAATINALDDFRQKMRDFRNEFRQNSLLAEYFSEYAKNYKPQTIPLDKLIEIMYITDNDGKQKRTDIGDKIVDYINCIEQFAIGVRYHVYDIELTCDIMGTLLSNTYMKFENIIKERNKGDDGTSDCKACKAATIKKRYQRSWCEFCWLNEKIMERKGEG
jgi:hypothetical protein